MKIRNNAPRLLVSVIAASECGAIRGCPPDIADLKNPADGSLGMPEVDTIRDVKQSIPEGLPLSVAIGDAVDDVEPYIARAKLAQAAGADIVKVGLFGFESARREEIFLSRLCRSVGVPVVAAWYADRLERPLSELPESAAHAGASGCLIDSYDKSGGSLTDYVSMAGMEAYIEKCGELDVYSALAGSLGERDIEWLLLLKPDIAGFRGAVASGNRGEPGINAERLSFFRNALLPMQAGSILARLALPALAVCQKEGAASSAPTRNS